MTYNQGAWHTHTDEFKGRLCIKQLDGGWAIIREADKFQPLKAAGRCSLAHGDEPAAVKNVIHRHLPLGETCINVSCNAIRCNLMGPGDHIGVPDHCVVGHVWLKS